jgi:hypothetical protein
MGSPLAVRAAKPFRLEHDVPGGRVVTLKIPSGLFVTDVFGRFERDFPSFSEAQAAATDMHFAAVMRCRAYAASAKRAAVGGRRPILTPRARARSSRVGVVVAGDAGPSSILSRQ